MEFIAYAVVKDDDDDYPCHAILHTDEPYADLYNSVVLKLLVKTGGRIKSVTLSGIPIVKKNGKDIGLSYDWQNGKVVADGLDDDEVTATIIDVLPEPRKKYWME